MSESDFNALSDEVITIRRELGAKLGIKALDRQSCPACFVDQYDDAHRVAGEDGGDYYCAFSCGKRVPRKENIG